MSSDLRLARRRVPPPRLAVIMASAAHEAVVFRRGPSAWFHVIRWDTRHDQFHPGAWIRGRIYPEDCDLSPDGRLLVYKVHRGNRLGTRYTDCWTGISRSPWLTALALWPSGTTYGGGGRFNGPRDVTLRLGDPLCHHPDLPPRGLVVRSGAPPLHALQHGEGLDWRGQDQRGRSLYAAAGKLYLALGRDAVDPRWDRVLADFNGIAPDPQPAPSSARRPLTSTYE